MSINTTENESIVKLLLTSSNINKSSKLIPSPTSTNISDGSLSDTTHSTDPTIVNNQVTALVEKEREFVAMDHCYARPLNWTPESAFFQPTKILFMTPDELNLIKATNPLAPRTDAGDDDDDVIDVETVTVDSPEHYDKGKATVLMEECERHALTARSDEGDENWEDKISKTNWTASQNQLFNGMVKILNNYHLARLAHTDAHHEPVLRRIAIDKAARRARRLFATVSWAPRLIQWIHQLLIDNLNASDLGAYIDILQTLKSKVSVFVDKMMYGPNANNRVGPTSNEALFNLLKRAWDPCTTQPQNKPRKLPGNPIIVIVPSAPNISNPNQLKRQHKWITLLSNLSTVVAVHTNLGSSANRLTMISCLDQMLAATRAKIQEVKSDYPGRQIVLIGFSAGSALALQVAQVEHVLCVICLGFSVLTAEGKRGEPDDNLLELQCPVLFVIGQCSNTSLQEDVEDIRERMRVENGLIVIGFADDHLRVNKKKKRAEGITQSGVDRTIVDHVGEFISSLLLSPFPPQLRQSPIHGSSDIPPAKRTKMERKRNNSNGSSIDSEPPSPTPKLTRPVGRPPGSKGKAKLEAKWAAQVNQGIPSSSSSDTPTHNLQYSPSLPQPLSEITSNNKSPKNKLNSSDPQSSMDTTSDFADLQNKVPSSAAKMQAMGLNRSVLTSGTTLAHLLQNGCKGNTIPQTSKQNCSIKVLENVTLNTSMAAKLLSGCTGRSMELPKLSLMNSSNTKPAPVVLTQDGKLKSFGTTVKGTGNTPMMLPMTTKKLLTTNQPQSSGHRVTKYITSKKQLVGQRPPVPSVKPSIISSFSSNLPPPTNLTSQDIMDLPIIFADDNQMLTDNSKLHVSDVAVSEIVQPLSSTQKITPSNPVGKYVFINKQMPIVSTALSSTVTSTTTTLKRPTLTVPVRTTNPLKYTKIILSRSSAAEPKTTTANVLSRISTLSPEISIRKVEPNPITPGATMEDLENSIVSTTIKKPDYQISHKKDSEDNEESESHTLASCDMEIEEDIAEEKSNDAPKNNI